MGSTGTGESTFTWNLTTYAPGTYKVYVTYPAGATATDATYAVKHESGTASVTVDQTRNAGTWVELGSYTFTAGLGQSVTLTDQANGTVIADAVKLVRDTSGQADEEKKDFRYLYDPNANLTKIEDHAPTAKIDVWDVGYTGLNQIDTIKEYLDGALKNTTAYRYNENSAVIERTHDKTLATYRYDVRDLVDEVVNKKSATDTAPKVTRYAYTPRAERLSETKANGNTVTYDYFLSGVLAHSLENKPNGTLVAEHTLNYQGNLHRSRDHAKIANADTPGAYLEDIYTYAYDPRDRTTSKTKKEGTAAAKATVYPYLGLSGEILDEEVVGKLVRRTLSRDQRRCRSSPTGRRRFVGCRDRGLGRRVGSQLRLPITSSGQIKPCWGTVGRTRSPAAQGAPPQPRWRHPLHPPCARTRPHDVLAGSRARRRRPDIPRCGHELGAATLRLPRGRRHAAPGDDGSEIVRMTPRDGRCHAPPSHRGLAESHLSEARTPLRSPRARTRHRPLLPPAQVRPQGGGTQNTPDEAVYAAVVSVLVSGCAWRALPPCFGIAKSTAHRRFLIWSRAGVWGRPHQAVQDQLVAELLDLSRVVLDCAHVRATPAAAGTPSPASSTRTGRTTAMTCGDGCGASASPSASPARESNPASGQAGTAG